jgi:integrase
MLAPDEITARSRAGARLAENRIPGASVSPTPHGRASRRPNTRAKLFPRTIPLNVIQRQLGHANLGITSVYLQGIDNHEIIDTVHARRAPMLPASAGLRR